MADTSPYGVTQHADEAMVTANALVGERAGNVTAHQTDSRFSPAAFSTAPYVPPRPTTGIGDDDIATVVADAGVCRYRNCRQQRVDGFTYCERHLT